MLVAGSIYKHGELSDHLASMNGGHNSARGRVELHGSYRLAGGAQRIGTPSPNEEVEVTVTLRESQLPTADDITAAPLDAGTYAASYAASAGDAAKVKEELEKFGP